VRISIEPSGSAAPARYFLLLFLDRSPVGTENFELVLVVTLEMIV
jgi:hypothetical protein